LQARLVVDRDREGLAARHDVARGVRALGPGALELARAVDEIQAQTRRRELALRRPLEERGEALDRVDRVAGPRVVDLAVDDEVRALRAQPLSGRARGERAGDEEERGPGHQRPAS